MIANVNHALILCGGKSSRMNKEKSSLYYYGEIQYKRLYALLCMCFTHVFFSVARYDVPSYLLQYPHITDVHHDRCGPMLGIVSAFNMYSVPWFVIAIDMPNITQEAINYLINVRNVYKENNSVIHASVPYTNDNFFEPLFAIYEPEIQKELSDHFKKKQYSLQKFLHSNALHVCKLSMNMYVLKNINTHEEYQNYEDDSKLSV